MSYRLVIDGNSVYEIVKTLSGTGKNGWEAEMENDPGSRRKRRRRGWTGKTKENRIPVNGQKKAGRTSARPLFGSYGSAAEEAAAVSPAAAAAEKQDDPDAAVVKAASAAAAASTVISTSAMSAAAAEKDQDPENVAVAPTSTSAGRIVGVASASAICSC